MLEVFIVGVGAAVLFLVILIFASLLAS